MFLRRLSLPGAEALCWHELTFFLELSAYRQPERVAQFSPDWLHWTGFQAQNDDRRDCLPEPVGKSFPEHLYNSQNHSATWTKGRGPRFVGFMEEHVKK